MRRLYIFKEDKNIEQDDFKDALKNLYSSVDKPAVLNNLRNISASGEHDDTKMKGSKFYQAVLKNQNLTKRIKNFLKTFPLLCDLMDTLGVLSTNVHEGRRLFYTLLYGGGDAWRLFEEVLSVENTHGISSPQELAKMMESHWSIFQADRVAGFIDTTHKIDSAIPLSKMIRLKPLSTLPALLFKECTKAVEDLLIMRSKGNGIVSLFYKGNEILFWDTIKNTIERVPAKVEEIVKQIGDITGMTLIMKEILQDVILEVSECQGEGAMIIVGTRESKFNQFIRGMDLSKRGIVN